MTIPRDWEGFARDVLGVGKIPAYQSHAMNTINEAAKAGKRVVLTSPPSAVRRPSAPAPSPTSGAISAGERGLVDTRVLARALREQRVTIIDQTQTPSADYLTIKIKAPSAGMDPRVKDALCIILAYYPILSRRTLTDRALIAKLTAEGYKGALALLAPLLHPRARGEAPRWLPGISAGQVAQTIDDLLKGFRLGA